MKSIWKAYILVLKAYLGQHNGQQCFIFPTSNHCGDVAWCVGLNCCKKISCWARLLERCWQRNSNQNYSWKSQICMIACTCCRKKGWICIMQFQIYMYCLAKRNCMDEFQLQKQEMTTKRKIDFQDTIFRAQILFGKKIRRVLYCTFLIWKTLYSVRKSIYCKSLKISADTFYNGNMCKVFTVMSGP
jgi:hypothetical protein